MVKATGYGHGYGERIPCGWAGREADEHELGVCARFRTVLEGRTRREGCREDGTSPEYRDGPVGCGFSCLDLNWNHYSVAH